MSHSGKALALSLSEQVGSLARASELRFAGAGALVWRLGWPELEAALPGGVPRGQVIEWAGPRSAGKTTALRQMVWAVRDAGAGAAYVDGTGTLTPAPWVGGKSGLGEPAPFWVVRPPEPSDVLAAAEELVRSGAFGLVIAEGASWSRGLVIRLQRLARGTGAALVAVVDRSGRVPMAGFRVRFSSDPRRRSYRVQVQGRGPIREVSYVHGLPYRLPEDSGLPDRRTSEV
jgi:hypothetical protein